MKKYFKGAKCTAILPLCCLHFPKDIPHWLFISLSINLRINAGTG